MRFNSTFAFVLATMTIAACGGDDGGVTPIDAKRIDSSTSPDAAESACDLPAAVSLGEGTGIDFRRQDGMTAGHYTLSTGIALGSDMPPTVMFAEFYNDYAPFGTSAAPGAIAAGTYTIDAEQANYATCGACVRLYTKYDNSSSPSTFSQIYMPNGGTITINSVTPTVGGAIDVTYTNLTMRQVTIDTQTFEATDVPGGCTSTISDAHFTGAVVAPAKRGNQTGVLVRLERDMSKSR